MVLATVWLAPPRFKKGIRHILPGSYFGKGTIKSRVQIYTERFSGGRQYFSFGSLIFGSTHGVQS
jgi:hypothetical protein